MEHLAGGGKTRDMAEVYHRAKDLIEGSQNDHKISILSNLASLLYFSMEDVMWVGFYAVVNGELVLFPFHGPLACSKIQHGKGVCGTAWAENKTLIVPDVDAFPGHIACSSASRSEIVVPVRDQNGEVKAVLDIDSSSLDRFGEEEAKYLELICEQL